MALDMVGSVIEHLRNVFGNTGRRVAGDAELSLWEWQDDGSHEFVTLATVGMSTRPQSVGIDKSCPSKEPRTELFCYSRRSTRQSMEQLLLDLAEYPFRRGTFLFWWQTVPLGKPIVDASKMVAVFLSMPPLPASDATFEAQGTRVDLLWVIPISAAELSLFRREGADALETALMESDTDLSDPFRDSVVT